MKPVYSPVNIDERQKLDLRAGDTVRVWVKVQERKILSEKEVKAAKGKKKGADEKIARLQAFEGLVIARKHGREPGATFTVRRVASGVGTEKIFPLYAPIIENIEILRRSKVRRAKLYYIREKAAREIRRKMKQVLAGSVALASDGTDAPVESGAPAEAVV